MSNSGFSAQKSGASAANSSRNKFQAVNINSVFSGRSLLDKSKGAGAPKHGLQSLGKQAAVARRMPPPASLPSLRAECAGQDADVALVPSGGGGWAQQDQAAADAGRPSLDQKRQQGYAGDGDVRNRPPRSDMRPSWSIRADELNQPAVVGGRFGVPSNRDFPSLDAAGDGKLNDSALSLRPQKSGSWRSGGGGALGKGGDGEGAPSSDVRGPDYVSSRQPPSQPNDPRPSHPFYSRTPPPLSYPPSQYYPDDRYSARDYDKPPPPPPPPPTGYYAKERPLYDGYPPEGYYASRPPPPPLTHDDWYGGGAYRPQPEYDAYRPGPPPPPMTRNGDMQQYSAYDAYQRESPRLDAPPPPPPQHDDRYQHSQPPPPADRRDRVVWSDHEDDRYAPSRPPPPPMQQQQQQQMQQPYPPPHYQQAPDPYNDVRLRQYHARYGPPPPTVEPIRDGGRDYGPPPPPPPQHHPGYDAYAAYGRPRYAGEDDSPMVSREQPRPVDVNEVEERRRRRQVANDREAAIERSRQKRRLAAQASDTSAPERGARTSPLSDDYPADVYERPPSHGSSGRSQAGRRLPPRLQQSAQQQQQHDYRYQDDRGGYAAAADGRGGQRKNQEKMHELPESHPEYRLLKRPDSKESASSSAGRSSSDRSAPKSAPIREISVVEPVSDEDEGEMKVLSKPSGKIVKRSAANAGRGGAQDDSRRGTKASGGVVESWMEICESGAPAAPPPPPPPRNVWQERVEQQRVQNPDSHDIGGSLDDAAALLSISDDVRAQKRAHDSARAGVGLLGAAPPRSRPLEFVNSTQNRRNRGGASAATRGRSTAAAAAAGGDVSSRRGSSLPSGAPRSRRQPRNDGDDADLAETGELKLNGLQECADGEEASEEVKKNGDVGPRADRGGSSRVRPMTNGRQRRSNVPPLMAGPMYPPTDRRMMHSYYFPFGPFGLDAVRGGTGRGRGSSLRGQASSSTRAAKPSRSQAGGGRNSRAANDGDAADSAATGGGRAKTSSRARGPREKGAEYAAQAKSPSSDCHDEWETASESSDVADRNSKAADRDGRRGGPTAQQRTGANQRRAREKPSTSASGRSSGALNGMDTTGASSTGSKNGRPASHQTTSQQPESDASQRQQQRGAAVATDAAKTHKADGLAGVDINLAGVIVIDDMKDVADRHATDEFQEVISKKERRLRKQNEQKKEPSKPARGERKRLPERKPRVVTEAKIVPVVTPAVATTVGCEQTPPWLERQAMRRRLAGGGDAMPVMGSWSDTLMASETTTPRNDVSDSLFSSPRLVEAVSSITGVEIWGKPDPVPFANPNTLDSLEHELANRAAVASKPVEFQSDALGSEGDRSANFDFTFDPSLPAAADEQPCAALGGWEGGAAAEASEAACAVASRVSQAVLQQADAAALGERSSLAEGPNVAKVRPQQQLSDASSDYVMVNEATKLCDMMSQQPMMNALLPQSPSLFGAADAANQQQSFSQHALFAVSQPPPRPQQQQQSVNQMFNFRQPPPMLGAAPGSQLPWSLGGSAVQTDAFGGINPMSANSSRDSLFSSQLAGYYSHPAQKQSPAPFGLQQPPTHTATGGYMELAPTPPVTLVNLTQPPPPLFGPIGSQRPYRPAASNQQAAGAFGFGSNGSLPGPASTPPSMQLGSSLLGPPPKFAQSVVLQPPPAALGFTSAPPPMLVSGNQYAPPMAKMGGFNPAIGPPGKSARSHGPPAHPQQQQRMGASGGGSARAAPNASPLPVLPQPAESELELQIDRFIGASPDAHPADGALTAVASASADIAAASADLSSIDA